MQVQPAAPADRPNLLGMNRAQLEQFFAGLGEKSFRAGQLLKWVHQSGVHAFEHMTNMSRALRERLAVEATIEGPEVLLDKTSVDGTRKWVMRMSGGSSIETVYIPEGDRGTLCVSSQIGCALDCSFCSTGKQGFNRNLTAAEIIGQVWVAARALGDNRSGARAAKRAITNIVFMGMGEPLLNFAPVVTACDVMMDDFAYGISKRRVTVSTAGLVPALYELSQVSDVSLAISLHAPNDALRDTLVPLNRRYPIAELLKASRDYLDALPDRHRRATVEYTLIAGVNDQPAQARELVDLLQTLPCKINLIPFNPFPDSAYTKPSRNAVMRFHKILSDAGYITTIRTTRGDDIDAACGQLVGQVADRTKRQARYRDGRAALIASDTAPVLADQRGAQTLG